MSATEVEAGGHGGHAVLCDAGALGATVTGLDLGPVDVICDV